MEAFIGTVLAVIAGSIFCIIFLAVTNTIDELDAPLTASITFCGGIATIAWCIYGAIQLLT